MNRWLGSVNHASITVSNLDDAMVFFEPWLDFLGYTYHERGEHCGTILDGPAEFPFGIGGHDAVYFLGPDNLKFEFVHMPALADYFGGWNEEGA